MAPHWLRILVFCVCFVINVFHIRLYWLPSRSNWSNCCLRESVPVFLRKNITNCVIFFPGSVWTPPPPPYPSGSDHGGAQGIFTLYMPSWLFDQGHFNQFCPQSKIILIWGPVNVSVKIFFQFWLMDNGWKTARDIGRLLDHTWAFNSGEQFQDGDLTFVFWWIFPYILSYFVWDCQFCTLKLEFSEFWCISVHKGSCRPWRNAA